MYINIDVSTPLTFTFSPSYQVEPSSLEFSDSSFKILEDNGVIFKAVFSSPVTVGVIQTSPLDVDIILHHQRVGEKIKSTVNTQSYIEGI